MKQTADIQKEYERWLSRAGADEDVARELRQMDRPRMEDAFYRDLAFGALSVPEPTG